MDWKVIYTQFWYQNQCSKWSGSWDIAKLPNIGHINVILDIFGMKLNSTQFWYKNQYSKWSDWWEIAKLLNIRHINSILNMVQYYMCCQLVPLAWKLKSTQFWYQNQCSKFAEILQNCPILGILIQYCTLYNIWHLQN